MDPLAAERGGGLASRSSIHRLPSATGRAIQTQARRADLRIMGRWIFVGLGGA
jgi:hypothetical protein